MHTLKAKLDDAGFKVPGPSEVFGRLVFSHELIHSIGGDEDTNKNMTRRLLLLLESATIDAPGSKEVHDRIIRGILNRYVVEDASFIAANTRPKKIPRFLLNDVVRFWRTMAVDYVNKFRARSGEKWALRNIKLRMSRKLLFISGLFMCLSWALYSNNSEGDPLLVQNLVDHLLNWTQIPLKSIATIVERYAPDLGGEIFGTYDKFLSLLSDGTKRKLLEQLAPDEAYEDEGFLEARELANNFDDALLRLMFKSDDDVTKLVKKYGVF